MTATERETKLVAMGNGIAQKCNFVLDNLEEDRAFATRYPDILEGLAEVATQFSFLETPIPDAAQILERTAKLQASIAIQRARA